MVAVCTNNITFRQKPKAKGRRFRGNRVEWYECGWKALEKKQWGKKEETQTNKSSHIHSQAAVPQETSQLQKPGDPTTELQTDNKLENASFLDRLFQCSVQGIQRSHDNSPDVKDRGTLHLKGQRIHRVFCVTSHELLSSNMLFQQRKMCQKGCSKLKIPIYGTATQRHISS